MVTAGLSDEGAASAVATLTDLAAWSPVVSDDAMSSTIEQIEADISRQIAGE